MTTQHIIFTAEHVIFTTQHVIFATQHVIFTTQNFSVGSFDDPRAEGVHEFFRWRQPRARQRPDVGA